MKSAQEVGHVEQHELGLPLPGPHWHLAIPVPVALTSGFVELISTALVSTISIIVSLNSSIFSAALLTRLVAAPLAFFTTFLMKRADRPSFAGAQSGFQSFPMHCQSPAPQHITQKSVLHHMLPHCCARSLVEAFAQMLAPQWTAVLRVSSRSPTVSGASSGSAAEMTVSRA